MKFTMLMTTPIQSTVSATETAMWKVKVSSLSGRLRRAMRTSK